MEPILIPIVALLIPIIVVPTALGLKHARFLREVEHRERMRAMELGRALPESQSWSPTGLAGAIGAGVPIASMVIAGMATHSDAHSYAASIWKAAGLVGLGGVICGTILAALRFAARPQPAPDMVKADYDPDAYDVVGRRG
jgi:hypothetical protein